MKESQRTLSGSDYNQTAKVISYGDSAKNYITRLARKVKEIAGTAKEKSLPGSFAQDDEQGCGWPGERRQLY